MKSKKHQHAAKRAVQRATRALLEALEVDAAIRKDAPRRAAALWARLLWGQGHDLTRLLGRTYAAKNPGPVRLSEIAIHLVCPHHLTVALGTASVDYQPASQVAGLGGLTRLVQGACARLVLQEEATADIARILYQNLGAKSVTITLSAHHPCQAIHPPGARATLLQTSAHEGLRTLGPPRKKRRSTAR